MDRFKKLLRSNLIWIFVHSYEIIIDSERVLIWNYNQYI